MEKSQDQQIRDSREKFLTSLIEEVWSKAEELHEMHADNSAEVVEWCRVGRKLGCLVDMFKTSLHMLTTSRCIILTFFEEAKRLEYEGYASEQFMIWYTSANKLQNILT